MIFSPQQDEAAQKISEWLKTDEKRFVLGGYAGTGKSTISKKLAEDIRRTHFCCYTGKGANVLREMGNDNVSTIHGALYKLVSDDDEIVPRYKLNRDSELLDKNLVIVDEYSMLPEDIIRDIEKMSKKVLYLGDPEQLPPVQGKCILEPDFFLTEIHRQALESPILRAANDVREGRSLDYQSSPEFTYQPRSKFTPEDYETADQVIVGLNKTRRLWNTRFRQKLGFEGFDFPQRGDKLICLKNNHEIGLFNGMIGEAKTDARKVSFQELKLDFEDYVGLAVWDGHFKERKDPPTGKDKLLDRFDYAYAITCHKSQGSQYDDLLVYNEPFGDRDMRRRWTYTAISRAVKTCKLVDP